jgi:hypothetical protein
LSFEPSGCDVQGPEFVEEVAVELFEEVVLGGVVLGPPLRSSDQLEAAAEIAIAHARRFEPTAVLVRG